jgi:S1-C subfamily serine protease
MHSRSTAALLAVLLLPASALALPSGRESRPDPARLPAFPSYVSRVHDAIVGLRVQAAADAPSSARLGAQRTGTGLVFDARGYAVTVSYLLLDAVSVEARTRDGRTLPGRVAAFDLDTGLGVVQLEGGAPWPAVTLGDSRDVRPGMLTGMVGTDEDNELVWVTGALQAVQPFAANWEYMLDRALILAPVSPSWSGNAVVDDRGRVIGIASLRLGEPPHVNLAIPIEKFVAVKDELIVSGRVLSRRPRPWLGLYTANVNGGVIVDGFSDTGPAGRAGFRKGDRIIQVDGVGVRSREEFYERLWRRQAGDVVELKIVRDHVVHVIGVRSVDRHRLLAPPTR